jgi:hypothetical protein
VVTRNPSPATIERLSVRIQQHQLRVSAEVRLARGGTVTAHLPDRELAALLPRSILAPAAAGAPGQLAETLAAILRRTLLGRQVRVWHRAAEHYVGFLSWRAVRFATEDLRIEVKKRT